MLQKKTKYFKSLDGFFSEELNFTKLKKKKIFNFKRLSLLGKGNSISSLPYVKNSNLISLSFEDKIEINKKKNFIKVNGNIEAYKVHNFLIENKYFFPSFPSYPTATVAACVANCVHGISPKFGIIKDFINEIKIYNPNFGYKILSRKKNKKLFELTIGGMGLTGLILEINLKVFKLKSSFIKIKENKKFRKFENFYSFLKKNNNIYNQNNFFLKNNDNYFLARLSTGNFYKKKILIKKLHDKKIYPLRLGIFKSSFLKKILELIILLKEYTLKRKIIHINEAFYPSNSRLLYFNLMSKKFIEHQTIIPHKNVKKFFLEFKKLFLNHKPIISLCHVKIFNGKNKYLQFNGKGLGLSIHFIVNDKFIHFYKKFLDLNIKYSCKLNLYKNSLIDINDVKKTYGKEYFKFAKEIKKLNKKYIFENRIFNNRSFYSKNILNN